MKKNVLMVFTLILVSITGKAQFNAYKYVVVPIKFASFKNQNQFKTSTITKHELLKQGLNVVYNDNLPEDLKSNRCLGLNLDLLDNSGMFATKVVLTFANCNGEEVYRTQEGRSKEKKFELSYREAIQKAVGSMDIDYVYQGEATTVTSSSAPQTVIVPIGNDVKEMKQETVSPTMADQAKKGDKDEVKEVVIVQKSTPEAQIYKSISIRETNLKKASDTVQTLYAQSVGNGYQLVDTTPKVVYELKPTTLDATFLVKGIDGGNGILHQKDGKWILEYDSKNGMVVRELNVKF